MQHTFCSLFEAVSLQVGLLIKDGIKTAPGPKSAHKTLNFHFVSFAGP